MEVTAAGAIGGERDSDENAPNEIRKLLFNDATVATNATNAGAPLLI
jgi:hypothetical protein